MSRARTRPSRWRVALALAALLATMATAPEAGGAVPPVARYRPPTDGEVLDRFRLPPEPWLPGNRGIEYQTAPGSAVTAIGPGQVTFAGLVARRRIVSVLHPDGLKSSYVGLAAIRVRVGERVEGGATVGLAADRLHLGVRRGRTYLDPALLWGRPVRPRRARLVPTRAHRRVASTLGIADQRAYTRRPAHRPVDRNPSTPSSPQRSLSGLPMVLWSWTSKKPLERRGP